ncbi:MAG: glycosyltransferase family 2 protein [Clostridia bacterium]|nr:glycosyltransferase family 2 protein [Clostridia bacterium]
MSKPTLSVVVPVYNEEEVINESYRRLTEVLEGIGETYELIFVNDGSRDKTLRLALEICRNDRRVKLIDFARNFGHQLAITAGMDASSGKAVVVIDADLQDPPEVIPLMLEKWREGYEIVYGKRLKREGESAFKKFTAKVFYRFLDKMTDVDIPVDTGDFRLIDRKVCEALKHVPEHNRYVRGIVSWLGYKSCPVEFERHKRFAGTTKYPLKKMIRFASDAIMSFSYKPLKLATLLGCLTIFTSVLLLIFYAIFGQLNPITSIVIAAIFIAGLLFLCLGIIGEYIARMCDEVRNRPLYLIRKMHNFDDNDDQ